MINKNLLICLLFVTIAQIIVWFSVNAQFLNEWFKKNIILMSILGMPVTFMVIKANEYGFNYFNKLWPLRFLGFSVGIIIFAILTFLYMKEGINVKTIISLILAMCILIIQIKF